LREEQREWFKSEMETASGNPVIVAQHCPPLPTNGGYHDRWNNSNADELLELFFQNNTLAVITGHWHRNSEWQAGGVRIINTGSLCGWQWNGMPPHYCFPLRPGYRLFHFDGQKLRTFWRDGSYWQTPAPRMQITIVTIGDAHSGGPRPQVRPIDIYSKARLEVVTRAVGTEIASVEWSITQGDWRPMKRTFTGIWSEWQADIDPEEFRAIGEQTCIVRAKTDRRVEAYDGVPIRLGQRECVPAVPSVAQSGRERVFDIFYLPR